MIKYTHLGRTGLLVSRLCLGTMNFGVSADEKESHAIMDRALEAGINFFDTADRYGKPQGSGGTEEIIGRWLALGGGRRESISNFAAWNIAQANKIAARRGVMGLVSGQSVYNLTNRMIELEVIPACRAYGLGLILWSPLSGGLLARTLHKPEGGRRSHLQPSEKQMAQLAQYEALCGELGEEPANVALAWLLHNPVVTAPIIGPRTVQQMESALRALEIELSPDVLARLDSIFPGPGDQAPEAYAW